MNNSIPSILPHKNSMSLAYSSPNAYAAAVKQARNQRRTINGGFVAWPVPKALFDKGKEVPRQDHNGAAQ